jgi:hypothetical protein
MNVTAPVGVVVFPVGPVTVAVKVTLAPAAIVGAEAANAVLLATGVGLVTEPYKFSKVVLPTRISGLAPAVRFAATAGPDRERFIRSWGMRLGAAVVPVLTEVKVPSPLP